jgi:hypothetical protein
MYASSDAVHQSINVPVGFTKMHNHSLVSVFVLSSLFIVCGMMIAGLQRDATDDVDGACHESRKLTASRSSMDSRFGSAVAIAGDMALIGAPLDKDRKSTTGSVYPFAKAEADRWTPLGRLRAKNAAADDMFGYSVALSGTTALIGAPRYCSRDENSGAAYVFQHDGHGNWSQIARLTASDSSAFEQFGNSVALDGNIAIIGSPGDVGKGVAGAAYLFQRDGEGHWNEIAKLAANDPELNKLFGWSVAISGQTALIGAIGDDSAGPLSGAVYVFRCDIPERWKQVAKLSASDAIALSRFGWSLALSGDIVVIGAHEASGLHGSAGATYVFQRDAADAWEQTAKLTASDAIKGDHFGWSVASNGRMIAVGTPQHNNCSGAVYLFDADHTGNWKQSAKYTPSDPHAHDWFGVSIALRGKTLLVGAQLDDEGAPNTGSAYIFELDRSR